MSSSRLIVSLSFVIFTACDSDSTAVKECGEGLGRADDGICYPLADGSDDGSGDDGSGDDGGGDDGGGDDGGGDDGGGDDGGGDDGGGDDGGGDDSGDDGGGDDGGDDGGAAELGTVTISGIFNFEATTEEGAFCNISSWVTEAVDSATGTIDRENYEFNDLQSMDCTNHPGGDILYELEITVDASTDVAFVAFVDPDGDPSTIDFEAQSDVNPLTVVLGETYTDIDFVVPTEREPPPRVSSRVLR